jgi:multidrug efflux pump subunit AcrA (membrane-fusion protein)
MGMGILLAVVGMRLLSPQQAKQGPAAAPPAVASPVSAQSVTLGEVKTAAVNRTLQATGTVAAFELIPVLSQASGLQVQEILVDEGDFVQAGQVLAYLDEAVLQAQLAQAKASVAQAQARLAELQAGSRSEEIARAKEAVRRAQGEVMQAQSDLALAQKRVQRNQNLEAEGAIARDRLDEIITQERNSRARLQQAQASLGEAQEKLRELQTGTRPEAIAQAQAQLAAAKAQYQLVTAQLNDARVVAPVSGKIAQRYARVGDITSATQKLFTIIQNGRLELLLKVPETQLSLIRVGQAVKITSHQDSQLTLTGKVREIEPMVDEQSRQATVKVDLPVQKALKPGMFLQVEIVTAQTSGLTVPMGAVLPQTDGSAIAFVVQANNTVKAEPIKLGEILPNQQVEITSGLQAGDRVVIKGAAYLKDGDAIDAVSP